MTEKDISANPDQGALIHETMSEEEWRQAGDRAWE